MFSIINLFTFPSVLNVSMIVQHVAFIGYEGSLSLHININVSVEKSRGILICVKYELNFFPVGEFLVLCGSTFLNKTKNVEGVSRVKTGLFPSHE